MKKNHIRLVMIVLGMCAAGVSYSCSSPPLESFPLSTAAGEELSAAAETETALPPAEQTNDYVYICGEIHKPGVYPVAPGSRVFEVVELAGGFTEQADPVNLNLAQTVSDGMKIVVLSAEQARQLQGSLGSSDLSVPAAKVNINLASKDELMQLNGIGETRADDIIRYRQEHGPFQKIEDIMQIPGIKEAAYQKIKDDISV